MQLMAYSVAPISANTSSGSRETCDCTGDLKDCRVLESGEALILAAIAETLKPASKVPVSSIVRFVDSQLMGPALRLLPACRQGFAAVEQSCKVCAGRSFSDLTHDEQLRFAEQLKSGHKLTAFFSLLADQCRRASAS